MSDDNDSLENTLMNSIKLFDSELKLSEPPMGFTPKENINDVGDLR